MLVYVHSVEIIQSDTVKDGVESNMEIFIVLTVFELIARYNMKYSWISEWKKF